MAVRTRACNLVAMVFVAGLSIAACGGSSPEPATAEHADGESKSSSGERDDGESPDHADSGEAPAAKRASCDDGTCTLCGDAQCPLGFYCDEGAKGGPACGWLPECAKKPTCACIQRAFAGSCEERNGGVYVKE